MLTERERSILKILHDRNSYVTIDEIAKQINFSSKTVRNDLAKIKEYILQNEFGALISKPKKGTLFQTTEENWQKLLSVHSAPNLLADSPSARKFVICEILLKKRETNMSELEKQLFLTRNGVEKALGEAKDWLWKRNIELKTIRGKGIRIVGTEFARRLALLELFSAMQKKAGADGRVIDGESVTYKLEMVNQISSFLDCFNAINVICAVQETENEFGIQFGYESQKELVFLLSLVIVCCKAKSVIQEKFLKSKSSFNRLLANDLADRLEEKYRILIPPEERNYLIFCVSISEIQGFTSGESRLACEKSQYEFCGFIAKLINIIGEIIGISLKTDKALAQDLFLYLRTAVERLRYGIAVDNPLLPKIKTEYPNIFAVAWSTSILLENDTGIKIGENEIGFLTLYIGGAIERANSRVNVCILCNYGVGVSQLLRQRIERSIANIVVSDIVTTHDTQKIIKSGCDFIITTQNIGSTFAGKDVVVVDNFLLPYDVRIIEKKMFEVRRQKMNRISREKDFWRIKLFDSEFVQILDSVPDKDTLLRDMCLHLEQKGYVAKGFLDSVLEREKITSTEIGKQVAIPHGATKFVVRPIISVAILKDPIPWNKQNAADLIFLLALKPDSALHMKAQIMKFYSVLVTLTDDEMRLKYAKSIKSKEQFAYYMNQLTGEEKKNERK